MLTVWGCSDSLSLASRAKAHRPHNSESWNVFSACLVSGNDPFTIVNENTGKCITPLNDWIVVKDCDETKDMLWKWVSQHRLFHLQSQKCLGLDITKPTDSLRMFSCDSNAMLWWKCEHHSLYGAAQYQLALRDGHAIASTNSSDVWKKGGSEENLCAQPYRGEYWRGTLTYLLLYLVQVALNVYLWSYLESYTGESSELASSSRHWVVTLSCFYEVSAICRLSQGRVGEVRCLVRGLTAILWHLGVWNLSDAWAYVLSMITSWIPEKRKC